MTRLPWFTLGIGFGILALVLGLSAFVLNGVATANPPDNATVQFGDPNNAGSPFPPPDHDRSFHAADKLIPRNAVISQGGTVEFQINGSLHQVAVYEPGTKPEDIDLSNTTLIAGCLGGAPLYINTTDETPDDARLVAPLMGPQCAGGPDMVSYELNNPGRYLVICTFAPHFEEADMFGWVTVK